MDSALHAPGGEGELLAVMIKVAGADVLPAAALDDVQGAAHMLDPLRQVRSPAPIGQERGDLERPPRHVTEEPVDADLAGLGAAALGGLTVLSC